jgi:hypothetical protein
MGPVNQRHRVYMYCLAQGDQTNFAASLYRTHYVLIPGLRDTSPLIDLFYKRMLNFVNRCLSSQPFLVIFFTCQSSLVTCRYLSLPVIEYSSVKWTLPECLKLFVTLQLFC